MTGMRKVMAVASGGGHWVELRRIMPAFDGTEVFYVSTETEADADLAPARYYAVTNVAAAEPPRLRPTVRQLLAIVRTERPEVVVTTGAAPGFVALALAKTLCRSRTVWIDTVAHTEGMTLSGRLARPFADAWLVQWPHLARPGAPSAGGRCCDRRPGGAASADRGGGARMIFVTIGSMFPFDRMIRAMDAWAGSEGAGEEILAQIGAGAYEPAHMAWVRKLDRPAYADAIRRSRLVVAHAGVGSIVTAGEIGRPIVVLPRRAHLGEHTSDHQVETVGWLRGEALGPRRR